jgi:hypothetical protein
VSPCPAAAAGDSEVPLYQRLTAGHNVKARFSEDGCWHAATVKQVTHGGFSNATFTVVYTDYGNEEVRSWRDIELLAGEEYPSSSSAKQESSLPGGQAKANAATEESSTPITIVQLNPIVMQRAQAPPKKGGWRAKARRK